jgi:hypothetical protein
MQYLCHTPVRGIIFGSPKTYPWFEGGVFAQSEIASAGLTEINSWTDKVPPINTVGALQILGSSYLLLPLRKKVLASPDA